MKNKCEQCNKETKPDTECRCILCQGYSCSENCLKEHNIMMYQSINHEYNELNK